MGPYCKALLLNTLFYLFVLGVVSCGGGNESHNVLKAEPVITVSGKITFDLIPPKPNGQGLDFDNIDPSAARGILVQAVNETGNVVNTSTTDEYGNYVLKVNPNMNTLVRVSAKMKRSDDASWDVKLSDNTKIIANRHPLYISESSLFLTSENVIKNIHLYTGHNGRNGGVKSAAPFAILDVVYDAIQKVLAVDPGVKFPPLELHWSPMNNSSNYGCWTDGDIGTSFYTVVNENNATICYPLLQIGQYRDKIYILGDERTDADEFDRHVITHEWGHYFEQNLSRSDSIGGSHGLSDKLDFNIAFSEGWSNAFAAIVTNDPNYSDTSASSEFSTFNIESSNLGPDGWFSERSIQEILYDIYDSETDTENNDTLSLGFGPIYSVLTSDDFIQNEYQTTIFSFAQILKNQQPVEVNWALDDLMESQKIFGKGFEGDGEINDGGITSVLPVYKMVYTNSRPIELCYTSIDGIQNKLGNVNYVIFKPEVAGYYKVKVNTGQNQDHDLSIIKSGNEIAVYNNSNNENTYLSTLMSAEKHIIKVSVWDPDGYIAVGNYCFDLQVTTN
ncbi:hypothetical protein N8957_00665 [Porticoccaceae bacterium]|nr:hypothetical protein [Porticoccaceae bacterium]